MLYALLAIYAGYTKQRWTRVLGFAVFATVVNLIIMGNRNNWRLEAGLRGYDVADFAAATAVNLILGGVLLASARGLRWLVDRRCK